jgi:Flp pilus assembly protein TadG
MKRRVSQSGSAIAEFALVVPLYFMIIFALVQMGIVLAGYCGAQYAVQQGVRYAIVHGSDSSSPCSSGTISAYVAPYLWAAQTNSSTVTTTWNPNNGAGSTVTVSITLTYRTGLPFSTLSTVKVGTTAQGTILY